MNKLKNAYNYIKEKLQNRKTRAATILFLYLIFFIFVFIFVSSVPKNSKNISESKVNQNYSVYDDNYEYTYGIDIKYLSNNLKFLITGKIENLIQNETVKLYNEKTNNYEITLDYEIINPLLLDLKNIVSYVNNTDYEFLTNYKDGTIQKNYLINLNKIDSNLKNDENIEINVFEKNSNIDKITIDATNLDKLSDNNIISSKYTLQYKKIK